MRGQSISCPESAQETWLSVPGFPAYEVSSLGRFRRIPEPGNWRGGRALKPFQRKDGYCTIGLWRDGKQATCLIHRLVCEAFNGPPSNPTDHAAHDNGISNDNRAENLIWKPAASNLEDKRRHGTHSAGETHGGAHITEAAVVRAFELRADGLTLKEIGNDVGLHFSTVAEILARKRWAHVAIPDALITAAQQHDGRRKDGR